MKRVTSHRTNRFATLCLTSILLTGLAGLNSNSSAASTRTIGSQTPIVTPDPNAVTEPANPELQAQQIAAYTEFDTQVMSSTEQFGGFSSKISLGQAGGTITIHRKAGYIASPADVSETKLLNIAISKLQAASLKVVYNSVKFSIADLDPIYTAMPNIAPFDKNVNRYMRWSFNPDTNSVDIGVNGLKQKEVVAAKSLYGDKVRVYETTAVKPLSGCPPARYDCRVNDQNPFAGGLWVQVGQDRKVPCSTAFPFVSDTGVYMLTAGHCLFNKSSRTDRVYMYGPQFNNIVGIITSSLYYGAARRYNYDAAAIHAAGTFTGQVWVGGTNKGLVSSHSYTVGAYGIRASGIAPPQGTIVYTDGSKSGQHRAVTQEFQGCDQGNGFQKSCGVQNISPYTKGDTICQSGDSGGPVWIYSGSGLVTAVGIIKGGSGADCNYTRVAEVLHDFRGTILTGPYPG